jgi:hypothetical protein
MSTSLLDAFNHTERAPCRVFAWADAGNGSNFGKSATTNLAGHYVIAGLHRGTMIVGGSFVPQGQILIIASNRTENFALHK